RNQYDHGDGSKKIDGIGGGQPVEQVGEGRGSQPDGDDGGQRAERQAYRAHNQRFTRVARENAPPGEVTGPRSAERSVGCGQRTSREFGPSQTGIPPMRGRGHAVGHQRVLTAALFRIALSAVTRISPWTRAVAAINRSAGSRGNALPNCSDAMATSTLSGSTSSSGRSTACRSHCGQPPASGSTSM